MVLDPALFVLDPPSMMLLARFRLPKWLFAVWAKCGVLTCFRRGFFSGLMWLASHRHAG
jgi:hypothetical protein